jgi:integrase
VALTVKAVEAKRHPGSRRSDVYFADGDGLYLRITPSGGKSWAFCYMLNRKSREMGLGPADVISLAEARAKVAEYRKLLVNRIDPIDARRTEQVQQALRAAKTISFSECATAYIETHRAGWKNEKHADQWANTLRTYCGDVFGKLPVSAVDTALVVKALQPIWSEKAETASRLRARIEKVLDWATVRGHRTGENPARWRGHLDKLLPAMKKKQRVKHHAALPFSQVRSFIAEVRQQDGVAARALEFTILTAARTNEVIGAHWGEFDLKKKIWIIPAARMKSHRQHRVALSAQAAKLVLSMRGKAVDGSAFVFAGQREGKPLSNMAMLELLKRMGCTGLTVHGFRSTFRDWAAECTNYPREVAEMALAHVVSDQVEAAYRRGDLFDKRCGLMADWGNHCDKASRQRVREPIGT